MIILNHQKEIYDKVKIVREGWGCTSELLECLLQAAVGTVLAKILHNHHLVLASEKSRNEFQVASVVLLIARAELISVLSVRPGDSCTEKIHMR